MSHHRHFVLLSALVLASHVNPLSGAGPVINVVPIPITPRSQEAFTQAYLNGHAALVQAQASFMTAQAELIKAASAANESNARARETLEKTRTLAIDNQTKAVTGFYERRKQWDAYMTLHPRGRGTAEQMSRYSKAGVPQRLESHQFERSRGAIYWPAIFEREEFVEHRAKLDRLFRARRLSDTGPASELYREVRDATDELREQLRAMIDELPPAQYVAARKFIDGLAQEIQVPPEIAGVAATVK